MATPVLTATKEIQTIGVLPASSALETDLNRSRQRSHQIETALFQLISHDPLRRVIAYMRVKNYYSQGGRASMRTSRAAHIGDEKNAPLFRATLGKTREAPPARP